MNVDDHGTGGGGRQVKITGIETLPVSVGDGYDYAVIVVLVRTDEGLTGIGEASLAGRGRGVIGVLEHFADLLVGRDPGRIEHVWGELTRGTFWSNGQVVMSAVAGIDVALWDLKGKRLGVPVYDLLGGPTREKVRVYRHLAGDTAEALVEDALRLREEGLTALRYGTLAAFDERGLTQWDPQRGIVETIAATEALRTAVGDGVDLLLDAHTMFGPAEAAYLGHALEPYRLYFYEDPIRPLNPHSLRHVREKLNLPIATGEQLAHKWEFQPLIEDELLDYLRIDPSTRAGSPRRRRSSPWARRTGSARRCITRARRSTVRPACTSTSPCRTSASRSGWSSSRSTSSSRTRRARRAGTSRCRAAPGSDSSSTRRRPGAVPRATPRCRRASGPTAASPTTDARRPPSARVARRRRRRCRSRRP
jgi:L-alanine-DL-glutamate epimerase-like enolase superfamily enzyme